MVTYYMKHLGKRLKEERMKMNINQVELAKIMDVSKQTISNWENGARVPETITLYKLSELYNVTTDYLLGRSQLENYKNETLLKDINSLNPDDLKIVERIVESFLNNK